MPWPAVWTELISDTAGPLGLALCGLSDTNRETVKAEVEDSLARFAGADGYELPAPPCALRWTERPRPLSAPEDCSLR